MFGSVVCRVEKKFKIHFFNNKVSFLHLPVLELRAGTFEVTIARQIGRNYAVKICQIEVRRAAREGKRLANKTTL